MNRFNGSSWSGYQSLGGVATSNPSCTSFLGTSQAICAVRGSDNALYVNRLNGTGTSWSGYQRLGGIYTSDFSCASLGINQVICAGLGTNKALFVNTGP